MKKERKTEKENLTSWWSTELLTINFVHVSQNCFQMIMSYEVKNWKLLKMEWMQTYKLKSIKQCQIYLANKKKKKKKQPSFYSKS